MTVRNRTLIASLATVLALTAVGIGTAAGASQYPTVFTKFKYVLSGGAAEFKGAITSSKGACEQDRKIKLFRKHHGETKKIGGDHTDGKGKFVIDLGSGPPKEGTYHAEAKQVKVGSHDQYTCLERSSPSLKLSD